MVQTFFQNFVFLVFMSFLDVSLRLPVVKSIGLPFVGVFAPTLCDVQPRMSYL